MLKALLVFSGFLGGLVAGSAQDVNDLELARLLANDGTRGNAVEKILSLGSAKVPLLMSWARMPPAQVDKYGLCIGLAEAFGRLKTTEAIPFLIKNISVERWPPSPNTWMKTAEVIEERMPAVAALIQIGPGASRAIMNSSALGMTYQERLAAIFVVARIPGVPGTWEFLTSAIGQANLERHWAEQGLRNLRPSTSPRK